MHLRATTELPSHGGESKGTGKLMGAAVTTGINVLLGRGLEGDGEVKEKRGTDRKMETLNILFQRRNRGRRDLSKSYHFVSSSVAFHIGQKCR